MAASLPHPRPRRARGLTLPHLPGLHGPDAAATRPTTARVRRSLHELVETRISPWSADDTQHVEDGHTALNAALMKHDWNMVPQLLRQTIEDQETGAAPYDNCSTSLHIAIVERAPERVISQLASEDNVNTPNEDGDTALHVVVGCARWELVPVLLDVGADVDACNRLGYTPLHEAIRKSVFVSVPPDVFVLLISDWNVNIQCGEGRTALQLASEKEQWELMQLLVQFGAKVDSRPLSKAKSMSHLNM